MSPLRHWVSTNTSLPPWIEPPKPQAAAPKKRKMNPMYRSGLKAQPIHYGGATFTTWAQAEAATGKTTSAIRHAIKDGGAMIVIVPNALREAIYAKVDAAIVTCPDAAADREHFYAELLAHFNEYGVIPEFTLRKKVAA